MKPFAPVFLCVCLTVASLSAQETPIQAESEISEVTVYLNQARVVRTTKVALPAGSSVVRIEGLPTLIDDNSVQASGKSMQKVMIDSVDIRRDVLEEKPQIQLEELRDKLQSLEDSKRSLSDQLQVLNEKNNFLHEFRTSLASAKNSDKDTPPDSATIQDAFHFYGKEIADIAQQQLAIEQQQRPLEKGIQQLQQEINRLSAQAQPKTKSALIALQMEQAGEVTLNVAYTMNNASWSPLYIARADSATGQVELISQAIVRQQTGEDWKEVKLFLSTSRPTAGAAMPVLTPQWLDFVRPVPLDAVESPLMKSDKRGNAEVSSRTRLVAKAKADQDSVQTQALVQATGFSAVFEVKLPVTILTYNEPVKTTIATHTFKGELQYAATPILNTQAYLQVKLKNTSETPLLAGALTIFRDGDMVGSSSLSYVPIETEFDVPLGSDDAVKITRRKLVDKEDKAGVISKRQTHQRKAEIVIENTRSVPIRITIHDRIPVSQQGDITITNVQINPTPDKQDKDDGLFSWKLSVGSKEKATVTVDYKVEWPKEQNIINF